VSAPANTAAVLSIGDELIAGDNIDTNAAWLSSQLLDLGRRVVERRTAPDDEDRIAEAITDLAGRAGVVVATGGLGPTLDDLSRHALARAMGEELVVDEPSAERIAQWFREQGRELADLNLIQAKRPATARSIPNERGTAPGLAGRVGGAPVYLLPGPPREMRPMFEAHVAPEIRSASETWRSIAIHTFGLGESDIARRLGDLLARTDGPLAGTTASEGVVTVRLRAPASQESQLKRLERHVREIIGPAVFGDGEATLASAVLGDLRRREQTLVVVESCTGGRLGAMLTAVPGSSDVFLGGWLTYCDRFKRELVGVDDSLLTTHGAVSREVAVAMAEGGLARSGADQALAITGVAGPGGGSREKPVGTVWIARAVAGRETDARLFRFPGDRESVRLRSAMAALGMIRLASIDAEDEPLLWQREPAGAEPRTP
jgi:nicotinamide-nucleotide amidase